MRAWNNFADEYGTHKALADLDADQIKAVVDLLLLVMYADDKASVLEQMELEEQLCKLPAIADKRDIVDAHLAGGAARMTGLDAAGTAAIARAAADMLPSADTRKAVFEMAAIMAFADIQLAADESSTLEAVADALGIDAAAAKAIVAAQG